MANTPTGPRHHETRALLRAHLAAASGYRHSTRHCPVCHRLLRLAMESGPEAARDLAPGFTAELTTEFTAELTTELTAELTADFVTGGLPDADLPAVDLPDAEAAKDPIPAAGSAGK